jgi:outer membrane beta-barrel protein
MRRFAFGLCAWLLVAAPASIAVAQEDEEGKAAPEEKKAPEEEKKAPAPTPTPAPAATPAPGAPAPAATGAAEPSSAWSDIIVVPRKQVLKARRVELAPMYGVTINDPMIRTHQFGGMINYYLTDVLWLGVEGSYQQPQKLDRFYLTPQQYRRVPKANKYLWEAALDFGYVPFYGKFALFNKKVVHWEGIVTAGVGVTQSEVLPMDPSYDAFKNFAITPNVGVGFRVFLSKWLTAFVLLRDYMILDKFEPCRDQTTCPGKTAYVSAADAKKHGEFSFVNNLFFTVGVGFFLPPSFNYTTAR